MPQNVGGIEYTVDADTSPLLRSEKVVESSTGRMFSSFQKVERATKGYGVVAAGTVPQFSKMTTAVKTANKAFTLQKGAAQQAGFQLQDLIVQLQGGTSAFVALGQQGSQLAGILGPGGALVGAAIALASALGGVLYTALEDTEEQAGDLDAKIKRLQESTAAYGDTLRGLTILELNAALNNQEDAISDLQKQIATAETSLRNFDNALASDRLQGQAGQAAELREELERLNTELQSQITDRDAINNQIDRAITSGTKEADVVRTLVSRLEDEAVAINQSRLERALYVAELNNATPAQIESIRQSIQQIDAHEAEAKALKELASSRRAASAASGRQTRRDEGTIQKLEQELATEEQKVEASYLKRQEAILRTTEEGSARRNELLRNADISREQSLLDLSNKEIEENQRKLDVIAQQEKEAAEVQREMELQQLQERFNINEQTAQSLQDLADQSLNVAETINSNFANALLGVADNFSNTFAAAIVQGDSLSQSLRGVAQAFLTDILASLIKVGAQYAINAALGTSATAATTAASVTAAGATAAAWAAPAALVSLASFGANAAPATAGIASTIGFSQSLSAVPGLQNGGTAPAGQMRRVGEQGPELFTDGARQFLIPGQSGKVTSNSDLNGGGKMPLSINFNVNNSSKDAQFQVEDIDQTDTEITINAIVADIREGNGPVFRALTETTNLTSRANG